MPDHTPQDDRRAEPEARSGLVSAERGPNLGFRTRSPASSSETSLLAVDPRLRSTAGPPTDHPLGPEPTSADLVRRLSTSLYFPGSAALSFALGTRIRRASAVHLPERLVTSDTRIRRAPSAPRVHHSERMSNSETAFDERRARLGITSRCRWACRNNASEERPRGTGSRGWSQRPRAASCVVVSRPLARRSDAPRPVGPRARRRDASRACHTEAPALPDGSPRAGGRGQSLRGDAPARRADIDTRVGQGR